METNFAKSEHYCCNQEGFFKTGSTYLAKCLVLLGGSLVLDIAISLDCGILYCSLLYIICWSILFSY